MRKNKMKFFIDLAVRLQLDSAFSPFVCWYKMCSYTSMERGLWNEIGNDDAPTIEMKGLNLHSKTQWSLFLSRTLLEIQVPLSSRER